ncbi:magnesium transporter [Ureaplasma canigenitalium]|uniref:magnesium transporter n=1 Tax=Ureaplasma canigenitalium TaxID=42092 RepID=UPI0004E0C224|nr:magnesium transporter [Ureaplasma canigenitalium]
MNSKIKLKSPSNILLRESILSLYSNKDIHGIKKLFKGKSIYTIVSCMEEINNPDLNIFILLATKDSISSEIFRFINKESTTKILEFSTNQQLKIILYECFNDDVLKIMDQYPKYVKKILLSLEPNQRKAIKELEQYDKDDAGSIMNSEFLNLKVNETIEEALYKIKKHKDQYEHTKIIFVVDEDGVMQGFVSLHDLLLAESFNNKVSSIMRIDGFIIKTNDDLDYVIDIFRKYSLEMVVVVDEYNKMVGYISDNDIQPAFDTEATNDIYKMYGISKPEFPYSKQNPLMIFKSRILLLVILMVSETITAFLIDQFQELGQFITAGLSTLLVAPMIPVMTGTTGNAGSQAAASVIRSLSIGEITTREYWKVILKEFLVSLLIASLLCVVNFLRLMIYFAIIRPDLYSNGHLLTTIKDPMIVASIVSAAASISLLLSVIVANFLGASLPLFASKIKLDPTVVSTPILATLLDMITSVILFGFCILIILAIIDPDKIKIIQEIEKVKETNTIFSSIQAALNN